MLRVQLLMTPDPTLNLFGHGREGRHRHDRIAHQPRLSLPDGFKAAAFGILRQLHALAQIVGILQINGNSFSHGGLLGCEVAFSLF